MEKKYDIALFDLDGTLSESGLGVKKCIEATLEEMGKPQADLSDYSLYIGPPLLQTFQNLCGLNPEEAQRAVSVYIRHYDNYGLKYNKLYVGIDRVIQDLKNAGTKIAVCSSKYEPFAVQVTELLGIKELFDKICGSTRDGSRKEKEEIIPYAVKSLNGKMTDKIVLIGDTEYDAKGARITSVDFVGVEFGYGDLSKMKGEGMKMLAKTTSDLYKFLFI